MRERRNDVRRPAAGGAAGIAAAIGLRIWAKAAQRPVDSLAILGAGALSLIIIANAVFLQSGAHPAPFFANPTPPAAAAETRANAAGAATPKSMDPAPAARLPVNARAPQTVSARRNDQIAELISSFIGSPSRVTAVQRVLSKFGYGQIRPSGILDEATRAAIEKFEREHQLPVTGRLSDRLLSELAAMTRHPLD